MHCLKTYIIYRAIPTPQMTFKTELESWYCDASCVLHNK